ncbi:hypothetical protein H7K45_07160 [Mycobacterium yunnanensis]|uniref:Transmembrane protein n=1 Tax=Mycobacterium yunnanensis TaxID=368477 RepID=A0A9X2YJ47_9MYCO|nr:hypothetical protein [Mycobacterium yunnanensis]MCV7420313.1 hypothetical protein [Mycobacterium yunnanensis]
MSAGSFAQHIRWSLGALRRHPLTRATDRLEAVIFLLLFTATLLAIPFAAHVGDQAYESTMSFVREETQNRHSVEAQVLTGTPAPTDFGAPLYVEAKWTEGTQERTERIVSPGPVPTGEKITVWLDTTGKVVSAPLRPSDASVNATSAGWSVWLLAAVFCGLVGLAVRRALDRVRSRSWDRAHQLFAYGDDGWADRRG